MLVFSTLKDFFQKIESQTQESAFLGNAWIHEFKSISVRTSIRAMLIGGLLFPATCIDYKMVAESELTLFFSIKLMPAMIAVILLIIWKLFDFPIRVCLNILIVTIMTACMYRVGDMGNFVQLNGVAIVVMAMVPFYPKWHAVLLATYIVIGNVVSYFLWYQNIPLENAGLLAIMAFAGVFMAVARFRYRTAERNFKNSLALELKNQELEEQKQELIILNNEIKHQKEELQMQTDRLEKANLKIEEKSHKIEKAYDVLEKTTEKLQKQHKNIEASINYASRIQNSMLPDLRRLQHFFPESFVIFQPRDKVSGDFYWFSEVTQRRFTTAPEEFIKNFQRKIVVAVVDCTGHGVPGAFMSVLGSDLLNQIINERKITRPNLVLGMMHESIRRTLRQENSNNDDGMDVAICVIKPTDKTLEFAGARRPLVYVQGNEEPIKIKGTMYPVGGQMRDNTRNYARHIIDVSVPTTFYIFSDGYQDQFGGENGRRFMFSRLRKVFHKIHQKSAQEQKKILENQLVEWMNQTKNSRQIDDILMMGIKLNYQDK